MSKLNRAKEAAQSGWVREQARGAEFPTQLPYPALFPWMVSKGLFKEEDGGQWGEAKEDRATGRWRFHRHALPCHQVSRCRMTQMLIHSGTLALFSLLRLA